MQDFHSHRQASHSQFVTVRYLGHPEDTPHDIRARPVYVNWDHDSIDDQQINYAALHKRVVYRKRMMCAGRHNKGVSGADAESNADLVDKEPSLQGETSPHHKDGGDESDNDQGLVHNKRGEENKRNRSSLCDLDDPVEIVVRSFLQRFKHHSINNSNFASRSKCGPMISLGSAYSKKTTIQTRYRNNWTTRATFETSFDHKCAFRMPRPPLA